MWALPLFLLDNMHIKMHIGYIRKSGKYFFVLFLTFFTFFLLFLLFYKKVKKVRFFDFFFINFL